MLKANRRHSLYAQLLQLLIISALVAFALFWIINSLSYTIIDNYLENSDYMENQNQKYADKLQSYIDKKNLSSKDASSIKKWVSAQNILSIQIYKDDIKVFDSDYPDDEIWEAEISAGHYEWEDYHAITFSDGEADVIINGLYSYDLYNYSRLGEIIFSFILFLLLVLLGIRKKMRYITRLGKEIEILEGGQLDYSITIQGKDELSLLAKSLEDMRISFQELMQREADMTKENQRIVTEMSHDIRTPVTSILLYTEILKQGKYKDAEQRDNYIEKIDQKARRLKQLTDHLFEYSLTASEREVQLEDPEIYEVLFFDLFSETCNYLNQKGFPVDFRVDWKEAKISISSDYMMRIMDNITSNIIKYADPSTPVIFSSGEEGSMISFSFANKIRPADADNESTCIGLQNIKNMMQHMEGECKTEIKNNYFTVTLLFPIR